MEHNYLPNNNDGNYFYPQVKNVDFGALGLVYFIDTCV